jgi:hypothetical protein
MLLAAAALAASCGGEADAGSAAAESAWPDGWSEETHGKNSPPNYALLFTTAKVHSIELVISASDYQAMQENLMNLFGGAGGDGESLGPGLPNPPPEAIAACEGLAVGDGCEVPLLQPVSGTCRYFEASLACVPDDALGSDGGVGGAGGAGAGGGSAPDGDSVIVGEDPIYVPVEVRHEGRTWRHVGMRYKGNSSLRSSYMARNGKMPFRLHFDKYESDYPDISDQRFYGFKELTFASNWSDDSQVRETFVSELLRDRGVPAARCAFYRVSVDVGHGPEYWGLYTAIEDPSDHPFLDTQLGTHDGNLYKPEGRGADWTVFDREGFVKKNNKDEADWSDVEAAIRALLATADDPAAWRAGFSATFDVDGFLLWLAINTAMVNWDSYGIMAHNYYLYADPAMDRRLRFIPWDHNEALGPGAVGYVSRAPDAFAEMFHVGAGANWPLISRTLADTVHRQRYRELLPQAIEGLFEIDAATERLRELHTLIEPHVVGAAGERPGFTTVSSPEAFLQSVDGENGLVSHIRSRRQRVEEALAVEPGR